ncbi:MAG: hypothetical protein M9924_13730 [Rhizobiaceae bacterium]|nr:hypothetical protein [Rhizobiaceae bacterium]
MSHYKTIRRSHRSRKPRDSVKRLLFDLRQQEIQLEKQFGSRITAAKKEGRCPALILPKLAHATMFNERPAKPGYLCDRPAVERGYCNLHFISHVLYVPHRQSTQTGRGVTRRPFKANQLAIGRLSKKQKDLMNDLERLPIETPLWLCLVKLNEEDPKNPLPAISS